MHRESTRLIRLFARASAAATVTVVLASCGGGTVPLPNLSPASYGDTTGFGARGEYIVRNVAVCGQCHAAQRGRPDGPLSGGMEFKDWRLGTIRAANITPDSATGIGGWSVPEIVRAIRNGEDREGHLLAPVMPYEWFNGMSERDAVAVALYLKSQPPVSSVVKNNPNVVYDFARAFMLKPVEDPPPVAPARAPTAAYGTYLANHVGLCAECHTPRGGVQNNADHDRLFAGDDDPPSAFPASPANLTPDFKTGIGGWTEAQFIETLRTGENPRGDTLNTFMPWRQVRRMADDDLRAIFRYLQTLEPISTPGLAHDR